MAEEEEDEEEDEEERTRGRGRRGKGLRKEEVDREKGDECEECSVGKSGKWMGRKGKGGGQSGFKAKRDGIIVGRKRGLARKARSKKILWCNILIYMSRKKNERKKYAR